MDKKKVNVFSILIYIVLAFFIGFMIYYLVGYNSTGYRAVSTSDGIGYIVNKEDKYVITEARTIKNGDNLGVYLTISEETNKDNKAKLLLQCKSQVGQIKQLIQQERVSKN